MQKITKALLGISLVVFAQLSLAMQSGNLTSEYKLSDEILGSGEANGAGSWGMSTDQEGRVMLSISNTVSQLTTLTNQIVRSEITLVKNAYSNDWNGVLTPVSCQGVGCDFVHLYVPVSLSHISVDLDEDNFGTVSVTPENTAVVTMYTLTN